MNSSKLLLANGSVVSVRNHNSPYKLSSANLLPNFGAKKHPYAKTVACGGAAADRCGTPDSVAAVVKPQLVSRENLPLFDDQLQPAAEVLAAVSQMSAMVPALEHSERESSNITSGLTRPLDLMNEKATSEKVDRSTPAIRERIAFQPENKVTQERSSGGGVISAMFALSRLGRSPEQAARKVVQGELSLDRVTVKRNRLYDADLRVVSRESAPEMARAIPMARKAVVAQRESVGIGTALMRFFALGSMRVR